MAELTAVSMAAEGGIMGKMGCISGTLKLFSNRWKGFCILISLLSQSYFAEVLGRDAQWLNGGDSGTGKLTPRKPMKEVVI